MAENKQKFTGFIGPSYVARSDKFNNQRSVNLYLETDKTTGSGKEGGTSYLIGTPGLESVIDFEEGNIRCLYVPRSNEDYMYIVVGYYLYYTTDGENFIQCDGQLVTNQGFVSMADNGIDLMFVDGNLIYTCKIGGNQVKQITRADQPNSYPSTYIDYQDGYFLLNRKDTQYFFWSDLYSTNFPSNNLAGKAGESDKLIAVISNNKQIYLFGTNSIETWANVGGSAITPFAYQPGRFISFGCASAQSIVQNEGTIFWLGVSQSGGPIVYAKVNEQAQRVSTPAVEYAIQNFVEDYSSANAYGYQEEGHYFYCLSFDNYDSTWVFDSTEGVWHERQSFKLQPIIPAPVIPEWEMIEVVDGYNSYSQGEVMFSYPGYPNEIVATNSDNINFGTLNLPAFDGGEVITLTYATGYQDEADWYVYIEVASNEQPTGSNYPFGWGISKITFYDENLTELVRTTNGPKLDYPQEYYYNEVSEKWFYYVYLDLNSTNITTPLVEDVNYKVRIDGHWG